LSPAPKKRNLNKERAAARARYHRLVKAGKCCQCAKVPPLEGAKRCQDCREKNRKASRTHVAKQRKVWKALHICLTCGQRKAMPQRTQCGACADRRDENHEIEKGRVAA
jgi:hypothetical protein